MPRDENLLVTTLPKNTCEEVRVMLREYRGSELLDLRVYWRGWGATEWRPAKKGLSVGLDVIPDLIDAIQKAQAILDAGEWT